MTNAPTLSIMTLLVVAVGGAAGSVARYVTTVLFAPAGAAFPWATLLVNVLGSFLIGLFARSLGGEQHDAVLRLALTTGFCGGFTTFSALSAETVSMLQQGRAARAAAYITVSLAIGLAATALGLAVGRPRG